MASSAIEVFISYSHKDEDLRQELDAHLKILERQGYISAWHDRKIVPGAEWDNEISAYLEKADLILLLVSANFLASDYCWNIEIDRAIQRHEDGDAVVVPIILKPVDWAEAPFSKLQAMPKNAQPVVTWNPMDQAFADITKGLRQRAKRLLETRQETQNQTQFQAALKQYRQKVQEYLEDGILSFVEQDNLEDLAEDLKIPASKAEDIKTQELNKRQDYDKKLDRYRKTYKRALDHEFPLSDSTKAELKERQAILGLKAPDAERIEAEALAEKEAAIEREKAATIPKAPPTNINAPVGWAPPTTPPSAKTDSLSSPPRQPTPLESDFTEPLGNNVELDMVKIPAGQFWMGSPDNEVDRLESEGPQHSVTVPEFWMGKYPVTQAQWAQVAALPKVERDLKPFPSSFKGEKRPVESVSWYDAVEFCQRLSQKTGRTYRLPSEAEWEYACRARTITPFNFGETILMDLANYDGNYTYGNGSKGIYREKTTDVGTFPANQFGLYDMHGNVWEWCQDVWHGNYDGAPTDGSAWLEGGDDSFRLLRGGSWSYDPRYCRSASRYSLDPDSRDDDGGFRVVCAAARAL